MVIWGSLPVVSTEGYRYFVLFVDDSSCFCWYYPRCVKTDIDKIFDYFRTMVERLFSRSVKAIQSDLGGEYRHLHTLFQTLGIVHRQTCAYTHKQNGRVEWQHRHIVETDLALLAESSVPLKY